MFRGRTDNPNLRLGQFIKATAEGLGSDVSKTDNLGVYRIISLHHEVDEGGRYQNSFTALPFSLPLPPPNPNALPPVAQSEIADVIDLQDPKKLGRIRVRFHWPLAKKLNAESGWLRVTTPYSGDGKGQLFTPEKHSQVLIGFEHGRPDQPVVLGNLFHANNTQKASYSPANNTQKASYSPANNAVKGIQTASGNKITFHDEKGKEKILISSGKYKNKAEATKLEISFAKNGAILLKTKGSITLDAAEKISLISKEIELQADEKIVLDSSRTIDVQGGAAVKVAGQTLELEAQTTAKLAGQTDVTVEGLQVAVSGSTMTNIKGMLVKIN